ncbi:MAG TPA: DUF6771 family protein [Novosphingobium sp.]|nr:DUF6771 family protein [Novosphingobium sp.]
MDRIDEAAIADALLTAPGWARVGLSAPTEWLRESAASELARAIAGRIESHPNPCCEQGQLPL